MSSDPRPLRLSDVPFLAFSSRRVHPNQAVTLQALAGGGQERLSLGGLLRVGLRLARSRAIWVSREGSTLLGVAGLRRRGGRAAWEIDHLITTTPNEAFLLDLLDRAVATAGAAGAHRLFLRLADASPALAPALQHGFTVVTEETLYEAAPPPPAKGRPRHRPRHRSDDHALFRLHNQAVNQEVRWLTALAPNEWRAAQEPLGRDGREWLLPSEDNTNARAFIRLLPGSAGSCATILSDDSVASAEALDIVLHRAEGRKRLRILVPEYSAADARSVEAAGFREAGRYVVLVRPIAQRAHRLQMAEHAVEGSVRPVIQ